MGYNLFASWRCRSYIFWYFISFTYLYVISAKCFHLCYLRLPLPLWSRKVGNNCLLFFSSSNWDSYLSNQEPLPKPVFFIFLNNLFWGKTHFFVIEIRRVINLERGYWQEWDIREFPGMLERFCNFIGYMDAYECNDWLNSPFKGCAAYVIVVEFIFLKTYPFQIS